MSGSFAIFGWRSYKGKGLATVRDDGPSDPELTVLAELAHELGHVLVADANMDGIKRYHPRREGEWSAPERVL